MYFEPHQYDRPIDKFTQSELNDLIQELQLTKGKSELLGSRLREKNMLASGVKFSWYRNREKEFRKYYAQEDQLININKGGLLGPSAIGLRPSGTGHGSS